MSTIINAHCYLKKGPRNFELERVIPVEVTVTHGMPDTLTCSSPDGGWRVWILDSVEENLFVASYVRLFKPDK